MTVEDTHEPAPTIVAESRRSRVLWTAAPPSALLVVAAAIGVFGLNGGLFLVLNNAFAGIGDAFWSHVTLLGDTLVMVSLLVFAFRKRPAVPCALYVAALVATPVIRILKPALNVLRPPGVLEEGTFHLIGPSFSQSSFPSGHATTTFAFASVAVLMLVRPWWARALVMAGALVVGLSRVAIGIHWPLDVAAGAVLGWLAGVIGVIVAGRSSWYARRRYKLILGASAIVTSLALMLYQPEDHEPALVSQRVIGAVCLAWGVREFVMAWRGARSEKEGADASDT